MSLREIMKQKVEDIPKEWKTSQQIAAEEGISLPHAQRLLKLALAEKKYESRKFRLPTTDGRAFPTLHYREVGKRK